MKVSKADGITFVYADETTWPEECQICIVWQNENKFPGYFQNIPDVDDENLFPVWTADIDSPDYYMALDGDIYIPFEME
jgi:hypothetical protein